MPAPASEPYGQQPASIGSAAPCVEGPILGPGMRHTVPKFGRRSFLRGGLALTGLGLATGCGILPSPSLGSVRVPRIGYIGMTSPDSRNADELTEGLRELGYIDGKN